MNFAMLRVTQGPLQGQAFPLKYRNVTIGRSRDCQIHPEGYEEMSREHARLSWDGTAFVLEDNGSRNGTLVDGQRVQAARLRSGSLITMGDFSAELILPPGAPEFEDTPAPVYSPEPGPTVYEPPVYSPPVVPPPAFPLPEPVAPAPPTRSRTPVFAILGAGCFVLLLLIGGAGFAAWRYYQNNQKTKTTNTADNKNKPNVFAGAPHPGVPPGAPTTPPGQPTTPPGQPTTPPGQPTTPPGQPTTPAAEGDQAIKDATVLIAVRGASGTNVVGAGFLIKPNVILTNRHLVCEDGTATPHDVVVVFQGGTANQKVVDVPAANIKAFPLLNNAGDQVRDIAAINVADVPANIQPLPQGDASSATVGQQVQVAGPGTAANNPDIELTSCTVGEVDKDNTTQMVSVLALTGEETSAQTGGPVVDSSGHVLGMFFVVKGDQGNMVPICLSTNIINFLATKAGWQ